MPRMMRLEPFPQPPLIAVRHPVVLMHGFGMLAAIRRGGQLHGEAMCLRRHGVRAYAPNVAPYNPIAVRARLWKERLERVLEETGADRLNLVAHSMGGLDARYVITELGLHPHVAALVTVSTPHRGSAICDFIQARPERFQAWLVGVFNRLGRAAMDEIAADARAAVAELTPAYVCETFNTAVPDRPSVRYWSYAGRAGKGTDVPINPFLLAQNRILYRREGVNDGLVSVESARWGTFLGTLDADHVLQLGLRLAPHARFDANGFFRSVAEMLAREGL